MASSDSISQQLLHFNIDRYINPWIPHNRVSVLPKPVSRFLGHRPQPTADAPPLLQWPSIFLATVAGLCLVAGITNTSSAIQSWNPPVIIASLGASAVLDFNAIRTPLAQPRNSILGNTLSAIVGVGIAKLFMLAPHGFFAAYPWVAGAVGCACASLLMSWTNTVHPPGGATALLAATNAEVVALGWRFVPLVLLGSALLVTTGLIFNNVLRQYPMYWWTPEKCGRQLRRERDEAKAVERGEGGSALERTPSTTSSERTLRHDDHRHIDFKENTQSLHIGIEGIEVPAELELSDDEVAVLEQLQKRIAQQARK